MDVLLPKVARVGHGLEPGLELQVAKEAPQELRAFVPRLVRHRLLQRGVQVLNSSISTSSTFPAMPCQACSAPGFPSASCPPNSGGARADTDWTALGWNLLTSAEEDVGGWGSR
jgi:hypothetical protein